MLLGALFTLMAFIGSDTVMQEAASVVFVIGAYVTGRALENFMPETSKEVVVKNVTSTESHKTTIKPKIVDAPQKSIKLPKEYTFVEIKHIHGKPERVTRKQFENLINKYGSASYVVLGYE